MHPVLFTIGDFPVGTYGIMIVIGIFSGIALATWMARRRGLRPEFFQDLALVMLVSGFLGARILYILVNLDQFAARPLRLIFSREGFVFQGGFIAAAAAGLWFGRRHRVPLWEGTDIALPAVALAHGFGRIGCFLAGCCYGLVCTPDAPLASFGVQYPVRLGTDGQPTEVFNNVYWDPLGHGVIAAGQTPLPILPVQLLESAGNFLICLALVLLWRRRRFAGQVAALYLMLYSALRFGVEFLRGDESRGLLFGGALSNGQALALLTFSLGIALWWWRRDKGLQPIPPAPVVPESPEPPVQSRKL